MDFNQYLDRAWTEHATDAMKVAEHFQSGFDLVQNESEVSDFAHLVTHVTGQHLGNWHLGIQWLGRLQSHPLAKSQDNQSVLQRSIASLELASGGILKVDEFSPSERIRIYAMTTTAVCEQGDVERTKLFFTTALELAQMGLTKEDPANRTLAVTGNNLAATIEEKLERTHAEDELMVLAAETGRKYWEIAGTWLQVERAEYRLAHSYLKAGQLKKALEHAQNCIEISRENSAPALELFFGYEVLALVEKARLNRDGFTIALGHANEYFSQLSESDKSWCEKSLVSLRF